MEVNNEKIITSGRQRKSSEIMIGDNRKNARVLSFRSIPIIKRKRTGILNTGTLNCLLNKHINFAEKELNS